MLSCKVVTASLLAALLLLVGCTWNNSPAGRSVTLQPATAQVDIPAPADAGGSRSVLVTHMPALAGLTAGDEFDFRISAELTSPLYQGCGRIAYDPRELEPVKAERGALLPAGYVFIAPLVTSMADQSTLPPGMAVVPFAFTGTPGQAAIPAQSGEIVTVRFRLKQPIADPHPLYLLNDAAYLQLRDTNGVRLAFDLASQEVQQ